jgi:hypothetical protein
MAQIDAAENAVRIGMANQDCDATAAGFFDELPTVLVGQLRGFIRNVEMYAAQFPDWQQFVDHAAMAELEPGDIDVARRATADLAEKLDKPELADPEVPATLKRLAELRSHPGRASKRLAFALIRTVENFVSKALSFSTGFVEETAKETRSALTKPAGKAAAAALLYVAIESATGISGAASKVAEARWMQEAVSVLRRELQNLSAEK